MKKIISITLLTSLMFLTNVSKALTAQQINGLDCNGVAHDLFADLDAGKAVVVFFFMPACGSCPPPAAQIQAMANNIMAQYPGMITAYAMPFNNVTSCATTTSWVTTNSLSLYFPYDSGATQVANYGGFGMPTAVVLGGTDHRVMFATQSYSPSDTLIMRDSILALFGAVPAGINNSDLPTGLSSLNIYPNPASNQTTIALDLDETANAYIDIVDMTGHNIGIISNAKNQKGTVLFNYNTEALATGTYILRININGKTAYRKLNVSH
jgi:hypothetical protein